MFPPFRLRNCLVASKHLKPTTPRCSMRITLRLSVAFFVAVLLGTAVSTHARYYNNVPVCTPSIGLANIFAVGPNANGDFNGNYQLELDCDPHGTDPCVFCVYGNLTDSGFPQTVLQNNAPGPTPYTLQCNSTNTVNGGPFYLGTTNPNSPNVNSGPLLQTNGLYIYNIFVWYNQGCGQNIGINPPDFTTSTQFDGAGD